MIFLGTKNDASTFSSGYAFGFSINRITFCSWLISSLVDSTMSSMNNGKEISMFFRLKANFLKASILGISFIANVCLCCSNVIFCSFLCSIKSSMIFLVNLYNFLSKMAFFSIVADIISLRRDFSNFSISDILQRSSVKNLMFAAVSSKLDFCCSIFDTRFSSVTKPVSNISSIKSNCSDASMLNSAIIF